MTRREQDDPPKRKYDGPTDLQIIACPLCDPPGWIVTDDGTIHTTARPCVNGCPPNAHVERPADTRRAGRDFAQVYLNQIAVLFGRESVPLPDDTF